MPTINTWISDSDYNKYLVVKQKGKGAWTEFIHDALNVQGISARHNVSIVGDMTPSEEPDKEYVSPIEKRLKVLRDRHPNIGFEIRGDSIYNIETEPATIVE